MSSIMERMKKASFVESAAALSSSEFFKGTDLVAMPVYMMNVAFSGTLDGGFMRGLHQLAGPSKHFKSNMALVLCKAFQDKYKDGIILFYDSEFGATPEYFETAGIDNSRVFHIPITNIEELNFDLNKKLDELTKKDKVMIFVDSIGNLASKKEVEDVKNEKSVGDMTRAKTLKSLFRIVTPKLTTKDIPMVCINHTYDTQEMYSKKVVSGGTGIEYSSHTVFIIGKRQVKEGTELTGFEFVLNVNKSRFIKEKSAIPITVTYDGGVDRFSGLLDVALETGHVEKPKNGWFTRPGVEGDRNWRRADTSSDDFWDPLLKDQSFKDAVQQMFSLTSPKTFTIDGEDGVEEIDGVKIDKATGEIIED